MQTESDTIRKLKQEAAAHEITHELMNDQCMILDKFFKLIDKKVREETVVMIVVKGVAIVMRGANESLGVSDDAKIEKACEKSRVEMYAAFNTVLLNEGIVLKEVQINHVVDVIGGTTSQFMLKRTLNILTKAITKNT